MQLEKENSLLFKYLDTAASIFLVINKDHTIEMVNQKGCEILGYNRDEIEGKNWFRNYIPRNEKKELIQLFDRVIKEEVKAPDSFENVIFTKGKKRRLIHWRNALLKDNEGIVTGLISSGVDVTEQVIAQQKLRSSEEKNRAILGALPDVIAVHDEIGTIEEIHIPDNYNLMAPKESLEGKNIKDLLPGNISAEMRTMFSKVIRKQRMEILNVSVPLAERMIDFECRLMPLAGNKVLTIARNITKTKSLQQMVQLRNRALEAAGNGIIIADATSKGLPIIYCNPAFSKLTGYRRSEVLGKNCRFLQNDDRDQEAIKTMAIAIEKGSACNVVLRNYRKDGSMFWNELTITPLYDEDQRLTHFIGVQNDVTEIHLTKKQLEEYANKLEEKVEERTKEIEATVQKLVETNLNLEDQIQETKVAENMSQRSQAQFVAIAQNFPKGLIVVFNADFELVYVEGEELKRINLKKAEYEGKHIDDIPIFSDVQKQRIKLDILKTIRGKSLSFEIEFQDNSYSANSTPLQSDEEDVFWALFVYNNITEQKNIQKELAKALRIEQELNELKSRFISMASHEFRTPLSAILSSAILIGKQNEPGKEEHRKKHLARIRTHVKHLVVILNDFLSLSKLEEGKVQAKPCFFELIKFCTTIVDEMEATKKEGQDVRLKHTATQMQVLLDPKLLGHILTNLLSNALKYSEEGKEVVLEIQQTEKALTFNITDNGIGIPDREQKNLFERFFRAENATNIEGTGLGLHIVKQYVELMEGSVSFTSKVGKGSTFTVQLPLNSEQHEESIGY